MRKSPLVETAKKIEALLQEALALAEGTGIISKTFSATITVARKNVMKRAYDIEDNKKEPRQ